MMVVYKKNVDEILAMVFVGVVSISFIQTLFTYPLLDALQIILTQYIMCGGLFAIAIKVMAMQTKVQSPKPIKIMFFWLPAVFSNDLK